MRGTLRAIRADTRWATRTSSEASTSTRLSGLRLFGEDEPDLIAVDLSVEHLVFEPGSGKRVDVYRRVFAVGLEHLVVGPRLFDHRYREPRLTLSRDLLADP